MPRAYIAGIGTTGVIVAATLSLLAVVSALVAFRGLPQQDPPEPIRSYIVDEPSEQAEAETRAQAPAAAAVSPGDDAADAESADAPSTRPADPSASGDRAAGEDAALRSERAPVRETPASDDGGTPAPVPEPVDERERGGRAPTAAERLGRSLGETSDRLTTGIGSVLAPISPALGAQVERTGDVLADQLRRLGASH